MGVVRAEFDSLGKAIRAGHVPPPCIGPNFVKIIEYQPIAVVAPVLRIDLQITDRIFAVELVGPVVNGMLPVRRRRAGGSSRGIESIAGDRHGRRADRRSSIGKLLIHSRRPHQQTTHRAVPSQIGAILQSPKLIVKDLPVSYEIDVPAAREDIPPVADDVKIVYLALPAGYRASVIRN